MLEDDAALEVEVRAGRTSTFGAARDLPGHCARGTSRRRPPGDAKDEAPWKKKPEREFDRRTGSFRLQLCDTMALRVGDRTCPLVVLRRWQRVLADDAALP